jgi:hypothetical protein
MHRALDLLAARRSNAEMVALIEELGCGDEYDRNSAENRTTPKLRNLLAQTVRRFPTRTDTEGNLLADALVREAVQHVPDVDTSPFGSNDQRDRPEVAEFLRSLSVDGWTVQAGGLMPVAPSPVVDALSRLKSNLRESQFTDALNRLDHIQSGLDEGHWESVNSDIRSFLSAVFSGIAKEGLRQPLEEGQARKALTEHGFFRKDPRNPTASMEADFIAKLMALLGTEGSHAGASDQETAVYRYSIALLTADYFLARHRQSFG